VNAMQKRFVYEVAVTLTNCWNSIHSGPFQCMYHTKLSLTTIQHSELRVDAIQGARQPVSSYCSCTALTAGADIGCGCTQFREVQTPTSCRARILAARTLLVAAGLALQ
jgi:hypothetical protein